MTAFQLDVASIISLRNISFRQRTGLFFVEGARFVVAAVDHGARIHGVVTSPRVLTSPMGQMLSRRLRQRGVPELRVTPDVYRRLSTMAEPPGVGAVLEQRFTNLGSAPPQTHELWVALHQARSPGNVGTLMRTCVAVGATGLIVPLSGVDAYDPATVRASMGAVLKLQLCRASFPALRDFAARGRVVVGATPHATLDYREGPYLGPTVLLLGSERTGLSPQQHALCKATVRIPMVDGDSLNLGVAGSVMLYAVWNQRNPLRLSPLPGSGDPASAPPPT